MICQRARELIHPCLDGELAALQVNELRRHFDQCEECDLAYRKQLALQTTLQDKSLYHHSPSDLRNRVISSLRDETGSEPPQVNDYAELSTH